MIHPMRRSLLRDPGRPRARRQPRWAAVVALTGLLAWFVALAPVAAAQEDPAGDIPKLPATCNNYSNPEQPPGPCFITSYQPGRPTVVLWGDSHAWQWTPALQAAVRGKGVNLVGFWWGSCPPMRSVISSWKEYAGATKCQQTNFRAWQFVQRLDRQNRKLRVVLGAYWQQYRAALMGLAHYDYGEAQKWKFAVKMAKLFARNGPPLFRMLGRRAIGTDVIGQAPVVPESQASACAPVQYACAYRRSDALLQHRGTRAWVLDKMRPLQRRPRLIDVADRLCTDQMCPGRLLDGTYTFLDVVHLTATRTAGARRLFLPTVQRLR